MAPWLAVVELYGSWGAAAWTPPDAAGVLDAWKKLGTEAAAKRTGNRFDDKWADQHERAHAMLDRVQLRAELTEDVLTTVYEGTDFRTVWADERVGPWEGPTSAVAPPHWGAFSVSTRSEARFVSVSGEGAAGVPEVLAEMIRRGLGAAQDGDFEARIESPGGGLVAEARVFVPSDDPDERLVAVRLHPGADWSGWNPVRLVDAIAAHFPIGLRHRAFGALRGFAERIEVTRVAVDGTERVVLRGGIFDECLETEGAEWGPWGTAAEGVRAPSASTAS